MDLTDLTIEIVQHLNSLGYTMVNLVAPPEDGPVDAAIVAQKGRVRTLFLIALCDHQHPYHATAGEAAAQYVLQKQQHAAHTKVIHAAGPPWEISYPNLS